MTTTRPSCLSMRCRSLRMRTKKASLVSFCQDTICSRHDLSRHISRCLFLSHKTRSVKTHFTMLVSVSHTMSISRWSSTWHPLLPSPTQSSLQWPSTWRLHLPTPLQRVLQQSNTWYLHLLSPTQRLVQWIECVASAPVVFHAAPATLIERNALYTSGQEHEQHVWKRRKKIRWCDAPFFFSCLTCPVFFFSKLPDPRIISNFQNYRLPTPNTIFFPVIFCLCDCKLKLFSNYFGSHFGRHGKAGEFNKVQKDQNHGKAEATGFHGDSIEQEVEQLLRETVAEIGMSTENVKIKCLAKPIAYAFIYFKWQRWEEKRQISEYVKERVEMEKEKNITVNGCGTKKGWDTCQMLHSNETRHSPRIDLAEPTDNGQIVVRTCQIGSFEYHTYQDIESEVEEQMENVWQKTRRNDCEQPWGGLKTQSRKGRLWVVVCTQKHNQRDDKRKGDGGGRQKLKHVDGDLPCCMSRKSEDNEATMRETAKSRGKGGGRHKLRNDDGDVPLSMRSCCEEQTAAAKKTAEAKRHAVAKICAAAKQ